MTILYTTLASFSCFQTKDFLHTCEAKDVYVLLFKFRRHLCPSIVLPHAIPVPSAWVLLSFPCVLPEVSHELCYTQPRMFLREFNAGLLLILPVRVSALLTRVSPVYKFAFPPPFPQVLWESPIKVDSAF